MNGRIVLLGWLAAVMTGCAGTHDLYDEPVGVKAQVVRQAAERREAWLLLHTWKSVGGRIVWTDDEGLTLAEDPDGTFRRYTWSEVRSVTLGELPEREDAGMTKGALYGGVATGFVGGIASGRVEGAVIGAGVGALAGAVAGMTGAMSSSSAGEYQITEPYDRFVLRTVEVARIEKETQEAVVINWRGNSLWLPRVHTTVEPRGGTLRVTAPRKLFEIPSETR